MKKTTGERLQELATIYGENQSQMRERLGFSKSTMNNYWHDRRLPKQNVLSYIAEKYNVQEAWLQGYPVPMRNENNEEIKLNDNVIEAINMIYNNPALQEFVSFASKLNESSLKQIYKYAQFTFGDDSSENDDK